MSYDIHSLEGYSTVLTAPSPASSGTSLVVQSGDGTKFSAGQNVSIWPIGVQPTTANAEIARVTNVATDTLTITRALEGSLARTVVVGDQIANTITPKVMKDVEGATLGSFDYIISGCVWTPDAVGSTRAASMSGGTIWLNNQFLTVAAVTSRTFTASKDVYVDFSNNGDGTAAITYTDNTTNAASASLGAGAIRNAIVVVGASSIATAASINQGQKDRLLPINSSIAYTFTDSIGNIIYPRDSQRRLIGYRQTLANQSLNSGTYTDLTGLSAPVMVPTGRDIEVTAYMGDTFNGALSSGVKMNIVDVTAGVTLNETYGVSGALTAFLTLNPSQVTTPPIPGARTYKTQFAGYGSSTSIQSNNNATYPVWIKIELV